MAPAQSDLQPQSAPKATAAAQAAIGDGLVAEAQAFADELAAWRHDLHQMPELGNSLPQTSAYIQARLTEMEIPFATLVDGSCVVGLIGAGAAVAAQGKVRARTIRPARSSCCAVTWMPFPSRKSRASLLPLSTAACMLAATICMRRPCLVPPAYSRLARPSLSMPMPRLSCCFSRARKPSRAPALPLPMACCRTRVPRRLSPCTLTANRRSAWCSMEAWRSRACTVFASRFRARAAMARAPRSASTPSRPASMCTWHSRSSSPARCRRPRRSHLPW